MLGKTPRDGVNQCPYSHPKICYKFINNGTNKSHPKGCLEGDECNDYHPQLCKQSQHNRTCCFIKEGSRCRRGYHLRNTIYAEKGADRNNSEDKQSKVNNNERISNREKISTNTQASEVPPFQQDLLRLEIYKILQEIRGSPPPVTWAKRVAHPQQFQVQNQEMFNQVAPARMDLGTPLTSLKPGMTVGELLATMRQ